MLAPPCRYLNHPAEPLFQDLPSGPLSGPVHGSGWRPSGPVAYQPPRRYSGGIQAPGADQRVNLSAWQMPACCRPHPRTAVLMPGRPRCSQGRPAAAPGERSSSCGILTGTGRTAGPRRWPPGPASRSPRRKCRTGTGTAPARVRPSPCCPRFPPLAQPLLVLRPGPVVPRIPGRGGRIPGDLPGPAAQLAAGLMQVPDPARGGHQPAAFPPGGTRVQVAASTSGLTGKRAGRPGPGAGSEMIQSPGQTTRPRMPESIQP
jgi:hypothetical protein